MAEVFTSAAARALSAEDRAVRRGLSGISLAWTASTSARSIDSELRAWAAGESSAAASRIARRFAQQFNDFGEPDVRPIQSAFEECVGSESPLAKGSRRPWLDLQVVGSKDPQNLEEPGGKL